MVEEVTPGGLVEPSPPTEGLRDYLARERSAIEGAHRAGASGGAVIRALSDAMDHVVVALARAQAGGPPPETPPATGVSVAAASAGGAHARDARGGEEARGWAVVALGGYGRRELAPASDVDLMILHEPAAGERVERLARALFHPLWDLRLDLGHSARTIADCLEVAGRDLFTATALLEGRLLFGDAALFSRLEERLRSWVRRRPARLVRGLVDEMIRGSAKHGSSLYMLEPNIKKSGGGLRTLHFLRWIGLVRHGTADLGVLHARGLLTASEGRALREAQEFYWRVRNDLHFTAGRAADTVSLDDQLRLARLFGYADDERSLGVERFMRQYYIHATEVHETVERFIARTARKPLWRRAADRALARRVEEIFVLTPDAVTVGAADRERLLADPRRIMALFHIAQLHGREIETALLDRVRSALEVQDQEAFLTPEVVGRFREILSEPGGVADTLSLMHGTGALEKLVPEFREVHRLVQFNQYHKYTVDEHTLMVIRTAESLAEGRSAPRAPGRMHARGNGAPPPSRPADGAAERRPLLRSPGAGGHLVKAYREIRRKDVLHLAMLLHDIAKGRGANHSARGAGIAAAVARRLGYDEQDTRLVAFLVREHLTMARIALHRDLADEKVILRFARAVGNPETLRKLFVLTYADVAAVGPGSWTGWKEELVTALYTRTMDELTGSRELPAPEERLAWLRRELGERLAARHGPDWIEGQWRAMNERYLLVTPPETVERHLEWIAELPAGDVRVQAEHQPETGTTEYTVLTFDDLVPGIFARIAGTLAAKGLQILSAQLDTRRDGVVVDTFVVIDTFYAGAPPPERLGDVSDAVRRVLLGEATVEELVARHRRFEPRRPAASEPAKVEIDTESSDTFTIVEVFAEDRLGLLYVIAGALRDLGLSVHSAKVATHLDQALDVFYVTDGRGWAVTDADRLEAIRGTLVERIEAHARDGLAAGGDGRSGTGALRRASGAAAPAASGEPQTASRLEAASRAPTASGPATALGAPTASGAGRAASGAHPGSPGKPPEARGGQAAAEARGGPD